MGRLHGIFSMVDAGEETRYRDLDEEELRLAALMGSVVGLLESFRFGHVPDDCGSKLRELADELEARFSRLCETKTSGKPGGQKAYANERPWVEVAHEGWIDIKEAITMGKKLGCDADIPDLCDLTSGRFYKLLRKPCCAIQFMSNHVMSNHVGQPRGRVMRSDWERYLRHQKEQKDMLEDAVEQEVRERS